MLSNVFVYQVIQYFDRCVCCRATPATGPAAPSPAAKRDPEKSPSLKKAAATPAPGPAQYKAKWARFAVLADRIVFVITVCFVAISYFVVFPEPLFVFTH